MNSSGVDNEDLGTEDGYPSWWTLNTSAQYKFNDNLKLQVSIENILDLNAYQEEYFNLIKGEK